MPTAKDVFDNPENYWPFLTASKDEDLESQYFDRKEAGRAINTGFVNSNQFQKVLEQIDECVSAFANSNKEGSLLIVGISKQGEIKGIGHLRDEQRNNLTNLDARLTNQFAKVKTVECQNDTGAIDNICLIYVPYSEHGICQTTGNSPRAWRRSGAQNLILGDEQKEQIKRDKKIFNYEQQYCCPYFPRDIDRAVLDEFKQNYLNEASYQQNSDEDLLYNIGALIYDADKNLAFNTAGYLFFAANPQRVLGGAGVRLLRFETTYADRANRGLPTFDRSFTGPLTKQIRDIRTFFQNGGFFKIYQKRNPDGGFSEEPEYPYIAIDEAIVNAIAHREYALNWPIECEVYSDAFVVRNPGRILQRDHDVPEQFTLEQTVLVSTPRNSKLLEWLRVMRDNRGSAFVKMLSEGTKRMRDEMQKIGLPAPTYDVSNNQTTVVLFNNIVERTAYYNSLATATATEFSNLYPLKIFYESGLAVEPETLKLQSREFMTLFQNALTAAGWFVDNFSFGKIIAHRAGVDINLPSNVANIVRFYPAYSFQLRSFFGRYYLCIDYTLEVKNVQNLQNLLKDSAPDTFANLRGVGRWQEAWYPCKIIATNYETARLFFPDLQREEYVPVNKVIPKLGAKFIEKLLQLRGVKFDLNKAIKTESLASTPNAARLRAEKTQVVAEELAKSIFPTIFNTLIVMFEPQPLILVRELSGNYSTVNALKTHGLAEPNVEFSRHRELSNVREGITQFGSYDNNTKTIEIVPVCTTAMRNNMVGLIERLKTGKYKYRGAERTFGTNFTYNSVITVPSPELSVEECRRLLKEQPHWVGNPQLNRIFLIQTPENDYALDDESAPYYRLKRLLFENGIPCQMVDDPTLQNPDMKDLNLALNLTAKCGVVPWVLPDAIPDADFFIGLSYSQSHSQNQRLMAYANVFNQYGRWLFYSGNTETFRYEDRLRFYESLVTQTLEKLALSDTPSIYFHYSAKFSREDRAVILKAARAIRPHGVYHFVSINSHHPVRFYDSRADSDGSLSRGSYVISSPKQIYLSTTGYNLYRKTLGTPQVLEITIYSENPDGSLVASPDLKGLAVQILSLTKLNWASTDSVSGEPITIKYAGDIAYLTAAFLRQQQGFQLHPVLEKTPWFL